MEQVLSELRAGQLGLDEVALYRVARVGGQSVLENMQIDPETFDVYGAWDRGLTTTQ
jgi:hypothetical protein